MRNDRGYTYLITNGREYKIGITTKTPVSRVAELQTGSPTKISISGYSYNSNALAMEIELHKMFASKRLEGEWFALNDDDVAIIHHHFETNHLDEYFAPLSAKGIELKRKEDEWKAKFDRQWELDKQAKLKKQEEKRKEDKRKRELEFQAKLKKQKEDERKRELELQAKLKKQKEDILEGIDPTGMSFGEIVVAKYEIRKNKKN